MPTLSPLSLVRAPRPVGLVLSFLAAATLACNALGSPAATPTAPAPAATNTPAAAASTATPLVAPTDPPAGATNTPAAAGPTDTPFAIVTPAVPTLTDVIIISSPGLNSHLTSPLHVEGFAEPTFEQTLVIQITDAGGAVLTTQPTTIQADAGSAGPFTADVAFSTPSDQPGRISVFSTSARDGGLVHLASVEVDLLAAGTAVVEAGADHPEVHLILDPAPLAEVSGGTLHIAGVSEYVFEGALNVWLCGEGGSGAPDLVCGTVDNILAQGNTIMLSAVLGLPGPFTLDLPYTVAGPVQARLVVYSTSARDGGIIHLTSLPVNLAP